MNAGEFFTRSRRMDASVCRMLRIAQGLLPPKTAFAEADGRVQAQFLLKKILLVIPAGKRAAGFDAQDFKGFGS